MLERDSTHPGASGAGGVGAAFGGYGGGEGCSGGEGAALERLQRYVWDEDRLRTYFDTRNGAGPRPLFERRRDGVPVG